MKRAAALLGLLLVPHAFGQRELSGTAEIDVRLGRLQTTASVLMIAAHPDDENTALLAYFARGKRYRTGYLSLTRGEGGQNFIGSEQGDLLGVIRTEELLQARRIDGAEQYFTRAIDFGFSKTADETLAKWGREKVLGDVVWVIRKFRPDIIVLRFSGTSRDGHGHHQSSAILGKEAFAAAADPKRFPEQLQHVQPWQPKRVLFNSFTFTPEQEKEAERTPNRLTVDVGEFSPVLGHSYAEIAGMSRSMHRSQAFGAAERRGSVKQYLVTVAGEAASKDPLEGVDTGWTRYPGGEKIRDLLARAATELRADRPELIVGVLAQVRPLIRAVAPERVAEVDELIALCAGVWADASTDRPTAVTGTTVRVNMTVVSRLGLPVTWNSVLGPVELSRNQPATRSIDWTTPVDLATSQPYWLRAPRTDWMYTVTDAQLLGLPMAPPPDRIFALRIGEVDVELKRPVHHRYVDSERGELVKPFQGMPLVSLTFTNPALLFPDPSPRTVQVDATAFAPGLSGEVKLDVPAGWRVEPASNTFELKDVGQRAALEFKVTPGSTTGMLQVRATGSAAGRTFSTSVSTLKYEHIPNRSIFPDANAAFVRTDVRTLARNVGYVMGAGDEVPRALEQLGCNVILLDQQALSRGDLSVFDAIVTGVRAYNVRDDLIANQHRLLEYVRNGGTMVVQYNVGAGGPGSGRPERFANIGPYPLRISRDRVTVEEAPVQFVDALPAVMARPNAITPADFEGWVQERGLYFPGEWDAKYSPLISTNDPGEKPLRGGILVARHGKGVYVYTSLSWFRQLPAGVPGAYRMFANLLSAGKVLE